MDTVDTLKGIESTLRILQEVAQYQGATRSRLAIARALAEVSRDRAAYEEILKQH